MSQAQSCGPERPQGPDGFSARRCATILAIETRGLAVAPNTRLCTVLIVDIAGSVALHTRVGEEEAGRRIKQLLQDIITLARHNGGLFLKSYGDDVLATFEGEDGGAANAAETAIEAQRAADAVGLQLYAGLCAGPVEFGETMGHPVANGQAVNLAARLHKLVEDAPGRIFLPVELVGQLPLDLQNEASPFGARKIKGYGNMEVWSLAWRTASATVTFVPAPNDPARAAQQERVFMLLHRGRRVELRPGDAPAVLGRGPECSLRVLDPEPRISTRHMTVEMEAGLWMAHDVSRNGSWIRDDRSGEAFALLPGSKVQLPACGSICLGRSFAEDPAGAYVVRFALGDAGDPTVITRAR